MGQKRFVLHRTAKRLSSIGFDDNPYLDKEEYLKSLDNWTKQPATFV